MKRHAPIYTVDEYQSIMLLSIRKPKPTVTRMSEKMFDIHRMCRSLNCVKPTVDVCGSKIELRDKVRWLRITRFGWYQYKHSLNKEEPWKEVCLLRSGADILSSPSLELVPMKSVAITKAKLEDITKQLKFIPAVYQGLYLSLRAGESADVMDQASERQSEVQNINIVVVFFEPVVQAPITHSVGWLVCLLVCIMGVAMGVACYYGRSYGRCHTLLRFRAC